MTDGLSWFGEAPLLGFQQRFCVNGRLFRQVTPYQTIEVYDTMSFGRMLVLDGAVQTTERDEFIYHEMLTLVPMLTHAKPRRVAVIGGGDGGTLRRVLQFPVEQVTQIELDPLVTDACQRYLPDISAGAFADSRARVQFGDGVRFLNETSEQFDVILVDSTDPVGAAEALFSEQFYRDAARVLGVNGLLVTQSGSPLLMADELGRALDNMRCAFRFVRTYLASVPSYPGVLWSFTMASQSGDPIELSYTELVRRFHASNIQTAYYTPDVHLGSFALPRFLAARFEDGQSVGIFPG